MVNGLAIHLADSVIVHFLNRLEIIISAAANRQRLENRRHSRRFDLVVRVDFINSHRSIGRCGENGFN